MALFDKVKLALRRSNTTAFDEEIRDLIAAACEDLGIAGVVEGGAPVSDATTSPILTRAICTYCKMHFGETDEFDRLKKSYDEQKAQLSMHTGFTDWSGSHV